MPLVKMQKDGARTIVHPRTSHPVHSTPGRTRQWTLLPWNTSRSANQPNANRLAVWLPSTARNDASIVLSARNQPKKKTKR